MESKTNKTKRKYSFKNRAFFWNLNNKVTNKHGHSSKNPENKKTYRKDE